MLNDLETMCLSLVAHGHSPAAIADRAGVSRTAIAGLVAAARTKLGARNTLHAVALASRLDLVMREFEGQKLRSTTTDG